MFALTLVMTHQFESRVLFFPAQDRSLPFLLPLPLPRLLLYLIGLVPQSLLQSSHITSHITCSKGAVKQLVRVPFEQYAAMSCRKGFTPQPVPRLQCYSYQTFTALIWEAFSLLNIFSIHGDWQEWLCLWHLSQLGIFRFRNADPKCFSFG